MRWKLPQISRYEIPSRLGDSAAQEAPKAIGLWLQALVGVYHILKRNVSAIQTVPAKPLKATQPKQAMEEVNRVLKPKGQFLIFDVRRDRRRLLYWLIRFAQTFILPDTMKRINEPTNSFLAGYTPTELDDLISRSPFDGWMVKQGIFWTFIWGSRP